MSTAAASLPGDLPAAILDRLQRTDKSARAAIRWANSTLVGPTAGGFQKAAAQIQVWLIAKRAMRVIDQSVGETYETLLWLRGLKSTIEDADDELAARVGELLPGIDSLQVTMRSLRTSIVTLRGSVASATKSPGLRTQRLTTFHKYLAVQGEAFAALEAARWAVLEREADSDVANNLVGRTFSSAADLMASLDG